jgi:hypothetical protein
MSDLTDTFEDYNDITNAISLGQDSILPLFDDDEMEKELNALSAEKELNAPAEKELTADIEKKDQIESIIQKLGDLSVPKDSPERQLNSAILE